MSGRTPSGKTGNISLNTSPGPDAISVRRDAGLHTGTAVLPQKRATGNESLRA